MKRTLFSLILAAGGLSGTLSQAQYIASPEYLSPLTPGYMCRAADFNELDLYEAAADQLQRISTEGISLDPSSRREFLFLLGNAYSRTANPRCLVLLREFIALYPSSAEAVEAKLAEGDFYFFSRRYANALEVYNSIDFNRLDSVLRPEATYHRAFAMLKCGFFNEAKPLFATLKNDREYAAGALFGIAYADYMNGDYARALERFREVEKLQSRKYIPELEPGFYIAQILYGRGDYEDALSQIRRIEDNMVLPSLRSETMRVEGLSLFKLDNADEAFPILNKYVAEMGDGAAPDAMYALATILYDRGEYDKAAPLFAAVADNTDAIGQGAQLYLGQIAADKGDDNAAAIFFDKSSKMDFDRDVTHKALYNYIAALSRGGRVPFAPQIQVLERFLSLYPNSEKAPTVRQYLASAYFHEKDYRRALTSIEGITNPSKEVKAVKQKILYELGVTNLQNGHSADAAIYLKDAVALGNLNDGLLPQARLWLGDALYAEHQYGRAADEYAKAQSGLKVPNKGLAIYGQAYSLQQQDKFQQAAPLFRLAADDESIPQRMRTDACLRLADCLFYTGNRSEAARLYSDLSRQGVADSDYAAWRNAEILGATGDTRGKIAALEKLLSSATPRWMPDILSSLAEAYTADGQERKSLKVYGQLLSDYPESATAPRAALSLAEVYVRAGDDSHARDQYMELLRRWPTSPQAREADSELRRIFAAEGCLPEYAQFLRTIPGNFTLGEAEMEELTFQAVADAFNADASDFSMAETYVERYPSGSNVAEAWSMVARGREHTGNIPGAYIAWTQLEKTGDKEFLSEAYAGIMRTAPDAETRLRYARQVAESSGVGADQRREALFIQAEALAESGKESEAAKIWEKLSANPASLNGAKSAVSLGEYLLKKRDYNKAERVLSSIIDSGTPHSYWLARAYVVLADVYSATGKKYLAKQYLESLRDNYPGAESDIKRMISSRLSKL
ncbi:MAG: tetratricopeptide repeat protein [Clostridium sp.]|nr:tetratricopeptide repeat protein [Prevotella sp.]MCM1429614.1 tetratricopeptide repeat protein [Clostridium sp.]